MMDAVQSVRMVAQDGLARFGAARSRDASRKIGDEVLVGIASQAAGPEKALAEIAARAARLRVATPTAVGIHEASLKALAGGVPGPVGVAIATVGLGGMASAYSGDDRRAVAKVFLEGAAVHAASPAERALAETAVRVAEKRVANTTANNAARQALQAIAGGVEGSPEQALARFAQDVESYSSDDRRALGRLVLTEIAQRADVPEQRALAAGAERLAGLEIANRSAIAVEAKAFEMILQPPAGGAMAALGQAALADAYSSDDARKMSMKILRDLAKGTDPAGRLAGVAAAVTGLDLSNKSANAIAQAAFERLQAGQLEPLPVEVARLARTGVAQAYSREDAAKISARLMDSLGDGEDARTRTLLAFAKAVGKAVPAEKIFEALSQSRASVPSMVGAADPHAEALEGIAQALEVEKDIASHLDRGVGSKQAALATHQAELARAQQEMEAAGAAAAPLRAEMERFRKIGFAGFVTAGVGAIASFASGWPGLMLVAGVGVAVGLGGLVKHTRAQEMYWRQARESGNGDLRVRLNQIMVASIQGELGPLMRARDTAMAIVREHDAKVSVHRMVDAVNTAPDPEARVSVDSQAVTIGTLRVPKKAAGGADLE